MENNTSIDLSSKLSQYDNSNFGMYKGVFSTLDNEERGIIEVSLISGNLATAQLPLESGEGIELVSTTIIGTQAMTESIQVESNLKVTTRTSFSFTGDGIGVESIDTQAIFSGLSFTSTSPSNNQSSCVVSTSGNQICVIDGTTGIFNRTLNWSGTHEYSISVASNCSFVEGTWEMETSYGTIFGTFEGGDANCL